MHFADKLLPGRPYPLGAAWDGLGINFAVFSSHASRIDLCLFEPSGRHEVTRYTLPEYTNEVWHGYLPNATTGLLYGYRAFGPYEPERGHRFNPNKLLLDPYARALSGEVHWSDALYGFRLHSHRADLSFDRRDSAAFMPKGVITEDSFHWGDDRPPNTPWADTVIYEAHVRGLTKLREEVYLENRGTFAALGHPSVIDYLRRLGVTAVELLPVHAFLQDRVLLQRSLRNYWGYNTLAFFAPEPRYLATGHSDELRVAVRRLHAAGIEVILDVVYNHTAEGSEIGPTLSMRGLDNASYYRLEPGNPRHCVNYTGTGNTLNVAHPMVLRMVMDSLRYWVTSYHIDGFRFDLALTLARDHDAFDPGAAFFDALRQDPVLAHVKLIAEPWDLGPGGYHLGGHPPGFAEWNDRFRDSVRRFWRGDTGMRAELARRLAGSADLFDRLGRRPWSSVNFAACHDGFTLNDVVSYAEKHNEANGEDNRDGTDDNCSANWGVEGPADDPAVKSARDRVKRAMLATVMFSAGTPMLLAGDELGHTQRGNNNAYCQDNELSWINWRDTNSGLLAFVIRLLTIRRQHHLLRWPLFLHGGEVELPDLKDIEWFDENGGALSHEAWNDPQQQTLIVRRAYEDGEGKLATLTLLLNPTRSEGDFTLPEPFWPSTVLLDTADPDAAPQALTQRRIPVAAHSLILLGAERAFEGSRTASLASWLGLTRPSTSFGATPIEDDRGHDTGGGGYGDES